MLTKRFQNGDERLFPKRLVFDGPTPGAPEGPAPAALELNLTGLDDSALIQRANESARALGDKVKIAKDIVRRLELYDEGAEKLEAPLVARLRDLLAVIDASTDPEIVRQRTELDLRNKARAAVESVAQKAILALPSIGTVLAAFGELRQSVADIDLSTMATGGWERITTSFGALLYYIKDFLPPSIRDLLKDYIPDEAPTQTPETTAPGTATPEASREQLDANTVGLSQSTIINSGDDYLASAITFSAQVLGQTILYRASLNGEPTLVKQGSDWVRSTASAPALINYLTEKNGVITSLKNKIGEGNESNFPPRLASTLIRLQQKENGNSPPRIDAVKILDEKWELFKQNSEVSLMNDHQLRQYFLTLDDAKSANILRILKTLPAASPTTPTSPAPTSPQPATPRVEA